MTEDSPVTIYRMLTGKRGHVGNLVAFRTTPEDDELQARAQAENTSPTMIVAHEWRGFRRALQDKLTVTRSSRAIKPHDIPLLLEAWPRTIDWLAPDLLRSRLIANYGLNDTWVERIVRSPDLAVISLGWAIMLTHTYIASGMTTEDAARKAGLTP